MQWVKRKQIIFINSYSSEYANSKSEDLTYNVVVLYIQFALAFCEIIVAIFGICYVFCMLWIIVCESVEDFVLNVNYRTLNPSNAKDKIILNNNFVPKFEILGYDRV